MNKIMKALIGVIFFIIAGVSIASFIFWSRAPDIIGKNLTEKLGVKVDIEDMSLGWSEIDVENFEINNIPKGLLSQAFTAKKITIAAPLSSYTKDKIIIEKVVLDNVYIGLEFDSPTSTKGNWTQIMGNLEKSTGSAQPSKKKSKKKQPPPPTSSDTSVKKTVLIKELIINNISVDLVYIKTNSKVKKLPNIKQIVIKNIDSEEGFPLDQLTRSVLGQMLEQIFIKENLKNMLESLIPDSGPWSPLVEPFTDLFGS